MKQEIACFKHCLPGLARTPILRLTVAVLLTYFHLGQACAANALSLIDTVRLTRALLPTSPSRNSTGVEGYGAVEVIESEVVMAISGSRGSKRHAIFYVCATLPALARYQPR